MTPEEFERLKEQEKAHLRQLRDLKAQHRDVQRKKSIFDALRDLARPDLAATHDEQVGKLMQDAAMSEARLDLAMESTGGAAGESAFEREAREAAEREAARRASAEEMVRQMKGELGAAAPPPPDADAAKTIGRVASDEPASDEPARPPKSIGRPRTP